MLNIVLLLVATVMMLQVLAAENKVVDSVKLQQQISRIEQQLVSQNQQFMQQMENMHQLEAEINNHKEEINNHNEEINNHKDEINKLTHHIEKLEERNNQFQNKAGNLFGKVTHDNQNLRHLVTSQHKHNNSLVGFSAYASATRNYDAGTTVQFDTVITNEGGFYSGQTSTFLCVFGGYYLFSVNIRTGSGDYMYADIEIGGNTVASVWAADYDCASNTVIASCPQGKQVYVRCTANGHTMLGDPSARFSMFTGILLYSA